MNTYTHQESYGAQLVHDQAKELVKHYAQPQDHEAAIVALLIEALLMAGGEQFLKPINTEE